MSFPTAAKTPFYIQNIIAKALQSDATLAAFCTTNFGKALTVFSGFDPKSPPALSALPWAAVALNNVSIDDSFNVQLFNFFIGGACQASNAQTIVSSVTTFAGLDIAYEFGRHIQRVAGDALLANSSELGWDIQEITPLDFDVDFPFVNTYLGAIVAVKP